MANRKNITAAAIALSIVLPSMAFAAGGADGYMATVKVLDGDTLVTSATGYADRGKPLGMSITSAKRYGNPDSDAPMVRSGFNVELVPYPVGDQMVVDAKISNSEVTDEKTGALKTEESALDDKAVRSGDGWAFETHRLQGGKVLKVTFKESARPE